MTSQELYTQWTDSESHPDFVQKKKEIMARVALDIENYDRANQQLWYDAIKTFCAFNGVAEPAPFNRPVNVYLAYLRFKSIENANITTHHSKVQQPDEGVSGYETLLAEKQVFLQETTTEDFPQKNTAQALVDRDYVLINSLILNE